MTDLLSAEDIKKAVGAFAGEQRAPLPIPLPASPTPAPAPPGPASSPAPLGPCVRLGADGAGRGCPQHFPNAVLAGLGWVGRLGALSEQPKLGGDTGWAAVLQLLGSRTQGEARGRRQDLRFLLGVGDFPFKARGRGCRHFRLHSDPFSGQDPSLPSVAGSGPTTDRTPTLGLRGL